MCQFPIRCVHLHHGQCSRYPTLYPAGQCTEVAPAGVGVGGPPVPVAVIESTVPRAVHVAAVGAVGLDAYQKVCQVFRHAYYVRVACGPGGFVESEDGEVGCIEHIGHGVAVLKYERSLATSILCVALGAAEVAF